jgi:hypothetical protein
VLGIVYTLDKVFENKFVVYEHLGVIVLRPLDYFVIADRVLVFVENVIIIFLG